jgi:hypothetical protein
MKKILLPLLLLPFLSNGQCSDWYYGMLSTQVMGDTVILKDDTAHRNCGAVYWMRVYQYSPDTITWIQQDIGESIACMCTFNLSATIDSLHTGHYFVKTYYNDPFYGILCYMGLMEFDITKPDTNALSTKIGDNQSDCFEVGIRENTGDAGNEVTVYPNPASQMINIKIKNGGTKRIRILDTGNRVILERSSEEEIIAVDVSKFPAGVYSVLVVQEYGVFTGRFCKL